MGIGSKFGFGKKEPYRVPREVMVLRAKVEAENRENFPRLERYKELTQEAERVYKLLDAEIVKKLYAEEAAKVSEDIHQRLDVLEERIRQNASTAAAESGNDYVASNIDYLARKSVRNSAKTLFTEFLEGQDRFNPCLRASKPECAETLDSSVSVMIRTMAELSEKYFKMHGGDREIADLKGAILSKIADVDRFYNENLPRIREQANASAIESHMIRLRAASRELSVA